MSDMTAMELAQNSIATEGGERAEAGRDWVLAAAFFGVVLAMYAAIAFVVYSVVF
jgi:hypothetical protein